MIELVVTIVIIGILAVNILPRWSGNSGFDDRGFRDSVVAGLRYAQKSAVASRRTVCAYFSMPPARVSFRISDVNGAADCTTGNVLAGPDTDALPTGIIFDAAGRPGSGSTINVSGLPASLAITVEAETGYVH